MKDNSIFDTSSKNSAKIDPNIYKISVLTFFSVISPAILHANDAEFFQALLANGTSIISEQTIITISSLYDSLYYLAYFIGLIIGPFSDQKGKRKSIIVSGAFLYIIFSILLLNSPNLPLLLIFRFFQGVAHICVWQTLMVMIYDFSSHENQAKSISIHSIFLGMAMGSGIMLGGFLADFGVLIPFWFSIFFYLVVFVGPILLLSESKKIHQRPTLSQNFQLLRHNVGIIVPGIFNFIDRLHMGFLITIIPLYLTYIIPLSPGLRGMIFGLSTLPSLMLSYPVGKKSDSSWGRFRPLISGSLIYGILLSLTGYIAGNSLVIFIILMVLQGSAQGFSTIPTNSLLGDLVQSESKATAVAFFNFFGNIGIILGPILALLFHDNYNNAFLVAGILELIGLFVGIYIAKRLNFLKM